MLVLGDWLAYPEFDDDGEAVVGWHWGPPGDGTANLCGSLDLASVGQITAGKVDQPRPVGIFAVDSFPMGTGSRYLPITSEDPRDARPDGRLLDGWESLTGFRPQGDTVADLIWDHLTRGADAANLDGPGFLAPGSRRGVDLWLANTCLRSEKFVWGTDSAYTARLQDVLTRQLAVVRDRALNGECRNTKGLADFAAHQKFADMICQKYAGCSKQKKLDFLEQIKPASWDEPLVPHETTITDNFNRADNTDIGSGSAYAYTDVNGSMRIISNAVHDESGSSATENRTRVESDLSSVEMSAQISAVSVSAATARSVGPMLRFANGADTAYALRLFGNASGTTGSLVRVFRAYKCVAGALTALGSGTNQTSALPVPIRLTAGEGASSTLTAYYNGSNVESFTDSAIDGSAGARIGLYLRGVTPGSVIDDLDASDLAAAAGQPTMRRFGGFTLDRAWQSGTRVW